MMQIATTKFTSPLCRRWKVFGFLCFVFFLSACEDFQEVSFSGIRNVKIVSLTQNGVEAEITVSIKNPNSVSFNILKSDFDLTLNGINAGKAHLDKKVKIKAKSEETYTFMMKSDFSNLSPQDFPKLILIAMNKSIRISLKGNLKVGRLFVKRSYPVDINKNVSL